MSARPDPAGGGASPRGGDRVSRRRVILLLAAVLALASADSATVGAAATQLRDSLHISNADIGAMLAVSSGVGALATVPAGALVDRVSRVRLLSGAVLTWGVAMAASALAPSFLLLMLSRVGLGAVAAVAGPAVASLLGDFFPAGERSRIYGWVLTGELLGAGAGFILSGLLATLSWRACFACLVVPAGVLPWMLRRLPEPARTDPDPVDPTDRAPGPARAEGRPGHDVTLARAVVLVLRVPTNVVLIVSGAISYYFFAGVKAFGVEFAKGQYHVSQSTASLLTLLIGIGVLVGVVAGGQLGDRIENAGRAAGRILVAVVAIEVAAVVFVPALLVTGPMLAIPLLMFSGSGLGATNPPLDAARLQIMPSRLWGRSEGVRSVLKQAAESAAPLVFGFLADSLAGGGHAGLQAAFLIMLIPLAASGMVLLIAVRTYPKDARHPELPAALAPSPPPATGGAGPGLPAKGAEV